jgi:leucyl aminopeptidase
MAFDVSATQSFEDLPANGVAVCLFFDDDSLSDVPQLTQLGGGDLARLMERGEVRSRLFHSAMVPPGERTPGLLLVGAGRPEDLTGRLLVQLASAASRYLTGRGYTVLAFVERGQLSSFEFGAAAVDGAIRGVYDAGLLKRKKEDERKLDRIILISASRDDAALERGTRLGAVLGESTSLARDLVNLPPNEMTPTSLATIASELAEQVGLTCEVLDEAAMRERGMGSILGVSAGSRQPARVIVLRYGQESASEKLAFVGKGLTFDSGGLSLKTADGMETMKSDMAGAAAVIAGMVALARLDISGVSATGYVGATENMPGGTAMRPGDVLTAMNGETIEVLNTDAEGRLVLADVLSLAVADGATHVVDFATLTGGAVVALGDAATLAVGKPQSWVDRVVRAAERGFDRAWPMPLYREYREKMRSELADIKNTGGRSASALTAAAFLSDFASGVQWAHMDIAGTAFSTEANAYAPKGATGEGVGTIVAVAQDLAGEEMN